MAAAIPRDNTAIRLHAACSQPYPDTCRVAQHQHYSPSRRTCCLHHAMLLLLRSSPMTKQSSASNATSTGVPVVKHRHINVPKPTTSTSLQSWRQILPSWFDFFCWFLNELQTNLAESTSLPVNSRQPHHREVQSSSHNSLITLVPHWIRPFAAGCSEILVVGYCWKAISQLINSDALWLIKAKLSKKFHQPI